MEERRGGGTRSKVEVFTFSKVLMRVTRNYPETKLQENIDSEIMEVLSQEARESYDEEIVVELQSNTPEEMETNIERIEAWLKQWKEDNANR